jgi:hypothetical protein
MANNQIGSHESSADEAIAKTAPPSVLEFELTTIVYG